MGLCIDVDSVIEGRLAPHVETTIYRIIKGITNITKHAAAYLPSSFSYGETPGWSTASSKTMGLALPSTG